MGVEGGWAVRAVQEAGVVPHFGPAAGAKGAAPAVAAMAQVAGWVKGVVKRVVRVAVGREEGGAWLHPQQLAALRSQGRPPVQGPQMQ